MQRSKKPVFAIAATFGLAGVLAAVGVLPISAQEADRDAARERERPLLIERPRSAEPRSSDPSEGVREQARDRDLDASVDRGRVEAEDEGRNRRRAEGDGIAEEGGTEREPAADPRRAAARTPLDPALEVEEEEVAVRSDEVVPEIGRYDPLGVRIGSFLIFPALDVGTLYTDNVFESGTERRSDTALTIEPALSFRSNWSRHSLSGEVNAFLSYFREFESENDKNGDAALRGRIEISRRTNIEADATFRLEQESRGSVNVPNAVVVRPNEVTKTAALRLNHTINRVTLSLRGEVIEDEFEDAPLIGGGTFQNSQRDNIERELTGRVAYALRPGVAAFIQASHNRIEFTRPPRPGRPRRDSKGHDAQVGLSFDLTGKVTGEMAVGYARQSADVAPLEDLKGMILNGSLTWRATGLTTVTLSAASDIDASTAINSLGSLNQTVALAVEHTLRRNIILGAGLSYEIDDFAGIRTRETELIGTLSAEYRMNRVLSLLATYAYTDYDRTGINNDYTENEFLLSARLRR